MFYDDTQKKICDYLEGTKLVFEKLLESKHSGGRIQFIHALDLGFPHDVIRIAGGFATGLYVGWESSEPIIPVDTCVNACSVSFFEIKDNMCHVFSDENINALKERIGQSIYKLNFHRGNHFAAIVRSVKTNKFYLVLHSSANEFKDTYNGLYPTESGYWWERIKTFVYNNRYLRYLDGTDAELFWDISRHLTSFNEVRHAFIASVLLKDSNSILSAKTYHHYFMPNNCSVVMGGHISMPGESYPLLTETGKNIYMIRYEKVLDENLTIHASEKFITPHGLGKCDRISPKISISSDRTFFSLDENNYEIKYGASLRDHPNLSIRSFDKGKVFNHISKQYAYNIVDEFEQLVSWNRMGINKWLAI